ncbi:MAG: flagellar hook-associated protein FlgK [Thalassovita sp.]
MSLSSALSNALSGLTASSRGASVISSNLSNIMTEGYGVRDLSLSARSTGSEGGVSVNGVIRRADSALIGERRFADAEQAQASVQSRYMERVAVLVGDPTDASSLTGLLAEFEADLISAASLPESETRLQSVLQSASALSGSLNAMSAGVQTLRAEADRAIETRVSQLNTMLTDIQDLNQDIVAAGSQGHETAGLLDQRQALIDQVSAIVPVKELPRDLGSVALMTPNGVMLVDSQAAEVSFDARNTVTVGMSLENGLLSGLQVNGSDANLEGGELGGLLSMRDSTLPQLQAQLDTVALDLIDRFSGLDATLSAGAPGLFTDAGGAAGETAGIAARISINALADPEQGGAVWHLRDGLGAAQPGNIGEARFLQSMLDAMQENIAPSSDALGSQTRDAATLISDFMSAVALQGDRVDREMSFASVRQSQLAEMEAAQGVDTDAELQKLLLVEQVYAANAKLIQAVDEMLEQLMEIA